MNISERLLPPYNNPHDVELSPLPPILPIIASHNYRSCTCQKPLHSVHTNTEIQNTQIHKYIHTLYRRPEFARGRCTSFTLLLTSHCTSHTFPPFRQFPTSMTASSFEDGVLHILKISTKQCRHITQNKLYQNPIFVECCSILHCLAEK